MLALAIILATAVVHAGSGATVRVQVQFPEVPAGAQPVAMTTWLGEDRTLVLVDDGSVSGDKAGDKVFVGGWEGDVVRVLPVRLGLRASTGETATLAAFNEALGEGETDLSYAVAPPHAPGSAPVVRRVAAAWSSRSAEAADLARVGAAIGWTALVLGYVAWLVGRAPR